jgi:ferredoxin-NADP reductase
MKVSVNGPIRDLWHFFNLSWQRQKRIGQASADTIGPSPVNELANALHPAKLDLLVRHIRVENEETRTFSLALPPGSARTKLPPFRAGQYITIYLDIGGAKVSRPYSLVNTPAQAQESGCYEITIRKKETDAFVTRFIWEHWQIATPLECLPPSGHFSYEPLRDQPQIVGLAGGCGITPFRSLIPDLLGNHPDVHFCLIYGFRRSVEILFQEEWRALASRFPGRFSCHYVCSEPQESWSGPRGLLSARLIETLSGDLQKKTFFICGPQPMYQFLATELQARAIPPRQIRREVFGEAENICQEADFPAARAHQTFGITVRIADQIFDIPASSDETVQVALERAKLNPPTQCRSGECGFCRSQLLTGEIYVSRESDGRRAIDRRDGYFHPCASYPLSPLTIRIPRNILAASK